MSTFREKIGYGFGDMASSMFWKIFSYYLPFFYSNVYGLSLADTALLLLITRIWDAVSDPMMGIIADRTHSRHGKYRPYLLWVAVPFAVCGVLVFTTPDAGPQGKLIYAYVTYMLMMTIYTAINVPYSAMLGVMTPDPDTKTIFSSYRMFFAYGGSFIALLSWERLCSLFEKATWSVSDSWQQTMMVIALVTIILFLLCYQMTRERIRNTSTVSVLKDLKLLITNSPWWLLIGAALCSNLFNTVRGATAAYYFKDFIGDNVYLHLGDFSLLFYAGLFLGIGEVANMVGVTFTVSISRAIGKKATYLYTMMGLAVLSSLFFFIPATPIGYWLMLLLQIVISIGTGIISPLVWSMYADVSEYAELRDGTASTGLIFSSSSMAQKFGSAFGGSLLMWLLASFGYSTVDGTVQTPEAILGLKTLMSWVPALTALLAVAVIYFYPLTRDKVKEINGRLVARRNGHKTSL
ncbi:MAG: MFS transporter [Prevotellaceae bacterium]|nr:MFS transporter [Prevotellaceae bacterium]